jgi:hypothetical protein
MIPTLMSASSVLGASVAGASVAGPSVGVAAVVGVVPPLQAQTPNAIAATRAEETNNLTNFFIMILLYILRLFLGPFTYPMYSAPTKHPERNTFNESRMPLQEW